MLKIIMSCFDMVKFLSLKSYVWFGKVLGKKNNNLKKII